MVVGLPGTGIGGLFYLGMAILMPFHEAVRTLRGKSSWARWRFIGLQWALVSSILASLWIAMWLLKAVVGFAGWDEAGGLLAASKNGIELAHQTNEFFRSAATASFISLGAVIGTVYVLSWITRRSPLPTPAGEIIEPPLTVKRLP